MSNDDIKIESRLAVVERLLDERNKNSQKEHQEILRELDKIQKDVSKLKTTVAGVSAVVALVTTSIVKKFIPVLLACCMLMSPTTAEAQGHEFGVKKNPEFLVFIVGTEGGVPSYTCTGFITKQDTIITAAHCVSPGSQLFVEYSDGQSAKAYPIAVGMREEDGAHEALDWAILAADTGGRAGLPLSHRPAPEKPEFCLIYTAKEDNRMVLPCFYKKEIKNMSGVGEDELVLEAPILPGDSGGPIVDLHGEVIGIVVAYWPGSKPIVGLGSEIKYVVRALHDQ